MLFTDKIMGCYLKRLFAFFLRSFDFYFLLGLLAVAADVTAALHSEDGVALLLLLFLICECVL